MNRNNSDLLFSRALKLMPGGVNSPVRAFKSVGGNPLFIKKAKGAYLYDEDGNQFIDMINSWGPMILGHGHPKITAAVSEAIKDSLSFGAPGKREVEIASMIIEMVPSIDMVRMVNSGTEATLSAIRLARGYTGKDKIIKFEGCYHGHADSFLIAAGSGAATLGVPDSPGVTVGTAADTLTATYNDLQAVKTLVDNNKGNIAAIIIEPVAGNMGCIPPLPGFLKGLREICDKEKILLIFDEVMTGFRLSPGGAQEMFQVTPDLTTLGKIIGGGMPVGAYGGKKEIMENIAPAGPIYQAGTLSGNPVAMAAGIAMLKQLQENPSIYQTLRETTDEITEGLKNILNSFGKDYTLHKCGSMFSLFFTENDVTDFSSAKQSDTALFGQYFLKMLEEGIYLPPSQFEAVFVSTALGKKEINNILKAAKSAFSSVLI
ncbi:MAG: glutamate-1-semialdehyde 2,1-aminomutase [Cyclobacteriaceae bacterium]|nr:glutamate-1-semialdehyde 2,1-aminomutase [Cyclobacteriaceae bacterium]